MKWLKYLGLGILVILLLFAGALLPAIIKLFMDNMYARVVKPNLF